MRMTGNVREDAKGILLYVLENRGQLTEANLMKSFQVEPAYLKKVIDKLRGQKVLRSNGVAGLKVDVKQALGKQYLNQDDINFYTG